MIYLFYGPDEYGRNKKLEAFCGAILNKKPQTAFKKFFFDEEGELDNLYDFIVPRSLFESAKRVAILKKSLSQLSEDVFKRVVLLLGVDKESVLIFNENWEKEKIPDILKLFIKDGSLKNFYFEKLSESKAKEYLMHEVKSKNMSIEPGVLDYFIRLFDNDIYACVNELERISFLNVPITRKLIFSMDEYRQESGIFDFSKAVCSNYSIGEKMFLWEKLALQRTDSYTVFNYLSKSAGNLPLIKKISDADVAVKSGFLEPEQAILSLLVG